MTEFRRADRVAERLRAELSGLILRGRLHDPAARGVIVSGVKVSDDLSHATVYVRVLEEADARRQTRVVEAMTRASGFLRREVGRAMALRRVPELTFFWDEHVDRVGRIERLLYDVRPTDPVPTETSASVGADDASESEE